MQMIAWTCPYQEHIACREYRHLLQLEADETIRVKYSREAMNRIQTMHSRKGMLRAADDCNRLSALSLIDCLYKVHKATASGQKSCFLGAAAGFWIKSSR